MRELRSTNTEAKGKGNEEGVGDDSDEEDDGETSHDTRSKRRKITKHPTANCGGSARTRAGKKNGNGTGDTAGSDKDITGIGEKKRKRGAKKDATAKTSKTKKKATSSTTKKKSASSTTTKKESASSSKEILTASVDTNMNSPTTSVARKITKNKPPILSDRSNTGLWKSPRSPTPSAKKKALDEASRNKLKLSLMKISTTSESPEHSMNPIVRNKEEISSDSSDAEWVQCDGCGKWRKLPPDISADKLPDIWYCSMNTWQPAFSSCNADEEDKENAEHDDVTTTIRNNLPPPTTKNNSDGGNKKDGNDGAGKPSSIMKPSHDPSSHAPSSTKNFLTPKEPKAIAFTFGQNQNQLSDSKSVSFGGNQLKNNPILGTENNIGKQKEITCDEAKIAIEKDNSPTHDDDNNENLDPMYKPKDDQNDKEKKDDNKVGKDSHIGTSITTKVITEKVCDGYDNNDDNKNNLSNNLSLDHKGEEDDNDGDNDKKREEEEKEEEENSINNKTAKPITKKDISEDGRIDSMASINDNKNNPSYNLASDHKGEEKEENSINNKMAKPITNIDMSEDEKKDSTTSSNDNNNDPSYNPAPDHKGKDKSITKKDISEDEGKNSTASSVKKPRRLDVPVLINNIPDAMKVDVLSQMDNIIQSPSLKYLRLNDPILDPNDVFLPLRQTVISNDDIKSLSRDPETTSDSHLMYGGYTIHDVSTQIKYLKNDSSNWCCTLPANMYEQMCNGGSKYEIGNYLDGILNNNRYIGGDLLNYKFVSILVWHGMHFSKAYIFNASLVINGDWRFNKEGTKEPHACILYTNSSRNTKHHEPKKVGQSICTFLNAYALSHGLTDKKGQFNRNSMPIYQIEVPQQEDDWTCLYQTILSEHKMMEAVVALGNIRQDDVDLTQGVILRQADEEDILDSAEIIPFAQRFEYNPSDAKQVRIDLLNVVTCLKMIQNTSGDTCVLPPIPETAEIIEDIDSDSDSDNGTPVLPITRPKEKTSSKKKKKKQPVSDTRKEGRTALDRVRLKEKDRRQVVQRKRLALHQSILNQKEHPGLEEARKKKQGDYKRRIGEGAASLESYHDETYRRALFHCTRRTLDFGLNNEFVSQEANKTSNPAEFFSIFCNPIAEYPDRKGKAFMQYREELQCIIISAKGEEHKEQIRKRLEYILAHFDESVEVIDNAIDVDVQVMGLDRPDLINFIKKNPMKRKAKDRANNQEMLNKTNVVPEHIAEDNDYENDIVDDMGDDISFASGS